MKSNKFKITSDITECSTRTIRGTSDDKFKAVVSITPRDEKHDVDIAVSIHRGKNNVNMNGFTRRHGEKTMKNAAKFYVYKYYRLPTAYIEIHKQSFKIIWG